MADKAHIKTDEKLEEMGKAAVCHLFQSGKRNRGTMERVSY